MGSLSRLAGGAVFWAALCALAAAPAAAQVFPAYINYQGKLGDTSGNPLTGQYSFQFDLFTSSVNGTPLFTDATYAGATYAVNVVNGIYSVQIGSMTPGGIPPAVFFNSEVWLQVSVEAGISLGAPDVLMPRERLAASPFAFVASNAQYLGTGVAIATFTSAGDLLVPAGVSAGTFTATSSVTASAFFGDGSHLTGIPSTGSISGFFVPQAGGTMTGSLNMNNVAVNLTGSAGNVTSGSSVTASAFFGDGSHLAGIPSTASIAGLYVPDAGGTMTGPLNMNNVAVNLTGSAGNVASASSVTASAFFGDGSHLAGIPSTASINGLYVPDAGGTMTGSLNMNNVAVNLTGAAGNVTSASSVTASAFFGDGSHLAGIPSTASMAGLYVPDAGGTMTGSLNMNNVAVNLTGAAGNVASASSVTASAFFGDASHLTTVSILAGAGFGVTVSTQETHTSSITINNSVLALTGANGTINGVSSITASAFFGDGSHLAGIPSTASINGLYVPDAGGTMTGSLNMNNV
ncbi:MAG: hypothetical protein ACHQ49_07100, partial [Elusimicrobiota bacterium]